MNNLARLRQEADRWARKLDAHQVKTTADWHLYQRAMQQYRDALDAHFKTTANAAD